MLFFSFYWLYASKKSIQREFDNLTLANIFLNTATIEFLVSASWFMSPYYGSAPDILVFGLSVYLLCHQLNNKGVLLLDESYGFILVRLVLPIFLLWAIFRVNYFWVSFILIFNVWLKM